MKKACKILFFCFLLLFDCQVLAFDFSGYSDKDLIINPAWERYQLLTDEEKAEQHYIPEKYIYKYKITRSILPKYDTPNNSILNGANSEEILPSYFNLTDLDGKKYVNGVDRSQGGLGLCWSFATIGSIESNMLYKGIKGIDKKILLCNEELNPNSLYCQYKKDYQTNVDYINGTVDKNTEFNERYIGYVKAYARNRIKESYNPYENEGALIGDPDGSGENGANFSYYTNYLGYGLAPGSKKGIFSEYTTETPNALYSLKDVFDESNFNYQVTEYYDSFPLLTKYSTEEERNSWIKDIKKHIMEHGAMYISTYIGGKCNYYKGLDFSLIDFSNDTCKGDAHALQLIGWNDNVEYHSCTYRFEGAKIINYDISTEEECNRRDDNGTGDWVKIESGAWILKNSWGKTETYPYLTYNSTITGLASITEVSVKDYDNRYNGKNARFEHKNTNVDGTWQYITRYEKTDRDEYVSSINFDSIANRTYKIYLSNNGVDYMLVSSGITTHPGLHTVNIDNFHLTGNSFYVKSIGVGSPKSPLNVFTKNACSLDNSCDDSSKMYLNNFKNFYSNADFNIDMLVQTNNVDSGKLQIDVYNSNNELVTDSFNIKNNYLVLGTGTPSIKLLKAIPNDEYTLRVSAENIAKDVSFTIHDDLIADIDLPDNIFEDDSDVIAKLNITSKRNIKSIKWSIDDDYIATIDENGKITTVENGKTKIHCILDTEFGEEVITRDLIIYKKIGTLEEFISIFSSTSNYDAYFLTTDLDLHDVDLSSKYKLRNFYGAFNGDNHTIKNITLEKTSSIGLFANGKEAVVKNLKIIDSSFKSANSSAGGLFNLCTGCTITNIFMKGSVSAKIKAGGFVATDNASTFNKLVNFSDVLTGPDLNDSVYAGGIIGESTGSVLNEVINLGQITGKESSEIFAGGIVGYSSDTKINNSYNKGLIRTDVYDESASVDFSAGGIIGYDKNSFVENCYSVGDIQINSNTTVIHNTYGLQLSTSNIKNSYYLDNNYSLDYPAGKKNETQLKNKNTYKGWNFDTIWYINDKQMYPNLRFNAIDIESVEMKLPEGELDKNKDYNFQYTIMPIDALMDINYIRSGNTNIFDIVNNTIKTKNLGGMAKLVLNINGKDYEYDISVRKDKYTVSYYDGDNLLKQEEYVENEKFVTNYIASKESDSDYIYEFIGWNNYTEGMIITNNVSLKAMYKKIPIKIESKEYIVSNDYIILPLNKTLGKITKISKLYQEIENAKYYSFYKNNVQLSNDDILKTGLLLKNANRKYNIIVSGDATGDGIINIADVVKIADHAIKGNVLINPLEVLAADATSDNIINIADVVKIADFAINSNIN